MKELRWGFIGCGEVTEKKSGPAFSEVAGSSVVAVMSRTEQRSKWYTDAQELIDDPDVNAVYIATPPSSHATFAIMAMKAGKPVYVEKPLAASYDDCARINRISEQTGIPCFVAYYRRYLPYLRLSRADRSVRSVTCRSVIRSLCAKPTSRPSATIRRCLGAFSPRLPVVVISTIWLLISSTSCKICSA